MAKYLFRFVGVGSNPTLVLGEGADREAAEADADAKFTAAGNTKTSTAGDDPALLAMSSDAPEYESPCEELLD